MVGGGWNYCGHCWIGENEFEYQLRLGGDVQFHGSLVGQVFVLNLVEQC